MAKKLSPQTKGFSPFRELVGVTFTKVENGYSQCVLEVDKRLLKLSGILKKDTPEEKLSSVCEELCHPALPRWVSTN